MGVFLNIQTALDKTLAMMAGLPNVAWSNIRYVPVNGTSFLRPTLLPSQSSLETLTDHNRHPGIYSVSIFTPVEKGMNAGLVLADSVKTHFESNRRISQNGDTIFIKAISLGIAEREEAWNHLIMTIQYECYNDSA